MMVLDYNDMALWELEMLNENINTVFHINDGRIQSAAEELEGEN